MTCHAVCMMTHLRWSWIRAGPRVVDRNPPSNPPSPEGEVASGVRPPSLPQNDEAMDSPIGVTVPAGLDIETGVLLQHQTRNISISKKLTHKNNITESIKSFPYY